MLASTEGGTHGASPSPAAREKHASAWPPPEPRVDPAHRQRLVRRRRPLPGPHPPSGPRWRSAPPATAGRAGCARRRPSAARGRPVRGSGSSATESRIRAHRRRARRRGWPLRGRQRATGALAGAAAGSTLAMGRLATPRRRQSRRAGCSMSKCGRSSNGDVEAMEGIARVDQRHVERAAVERDEAVETAGERGQRVQQLPLRLVPAQEELARAEAVARRRTRSRRGTPACPAPPLRPVVSRSKKSSGPDVGTPVRRRVVGQTAGGCPTAAAPRAPRAAPRPARRPASTASAGRHRSSVSHTAPPDGDRAPRERRSRAR